MIEPKPVSELWRPELVRLPRLTLARRVFRMFAFGLIKLVSKICLNLNLEGMENIPQRGPYLIIINHLGDADAVAVISSLPRPPDALGKIELYDYGLLGKLIHLYGVIWVHRGKPDTRALRAALDGLAEGRVIVIAPEGRYSLTGALEQGTGGAAYLALKSAVPVLPIAVAGTENEHIYGHLRRFQRAPVRLQVGKPFTLAGNGQVWHEAVEEGTRRIMRELAELLPEEYRGAYASGE